MSKLKAKKLLAIAIALSVFSTVPLGVSAKSQNGTEKKAASSSTQSVVSIENKVESSTPSAIEKIEVTKPAPKVTESNTKATKSSEKAIKPQVKNGIENQLDELGKKLNSIESDTIKLAMGIDAFIKVNTTGSAIDTTSGSAVTTSGSAVTTSGSAVNTTTGSAVNTTSGSAVNTTSGSAITTTDSAINTTTGAITTTESAISTTGSAINTSKNKTAFINSTSGKLKALSNRLSAVDKSLKALAQKVDKNTNDQYKSLVSKLTTIKAKITKEMELLKTLNAK